MVTDSLSKDYIFVVIDSVDPWTQTISRVIIPKLI